MLLLHNLGLSEKTKCQFQIKFNTEDYLQMYKILQLFTNTFTSIDVIKNTHVQTQIY